MPTFTYQATDRTGRLHDGAMDAKDRPTVVRRLQEQNLFPLKVTEKAERRGISSEIRFGDFFNRTSLADVTTFTHQLSTLTTAGLTLERSLTILVDLTENQRLKNICREILKNVQGGSTFADALAKHPKQFSKLYVSMIRAGEAGGVVEKILARLSEFLATSQDMRSTVISAMVYPLILAMVAFVTVILMLIYVIPKFTTLLEDAGKALPLPTQIVLGVSDALRNYWWAVGLGILAIYWLFRTWRSSDSGARLWDLIKLKAPVIGDLIKKVEIGRFARTLGTLTQSGVPILSALMIVKEIVGNRVIAGAIEQAYGDIKEGGGISKPLEKSRVFPNMAVHMMAVGEETGDLVSMLMKVADVYDDEVKTALKRAMSLLEPAIIVVMGGFVGFIVFSILLAIFSVNEMQF